jgi:predicted transcriptional regulator
MTQEEEKIFTFWEVIATEKPEDDDDVEVNAINDEALSFWDILATEKSLDDQIEIIVIKHDTIAKHFRDLMRISESVTNEEKDSVREIIELVSDGMGEVKDLC